MSDIDLQNLDKRIIERMLRLGSLDDKSCEKFVKGLPDAAEKCEVATAAAGELDDDFENETDDEPGDLSSQASA
mgnify:FL=1